jgi:type IV secretory pathway VirJ component
MRDSKRGFAVKPDLERVKAKTLCIWGEDDNDSLCRGLAQPNVTVVTLRGSHHFEGDYAQLAKIILEALK